MCQLTIRRRATLQVDVPDLKYVVPLMSGTTIHIHISRHMNEVESFYGPQAARNYGRRN